jgi:hypothetical protein
MPIHAPDLTQRPPRSARVRLGGYVSLPRLLDKGRAAVIGKLGEFNYNCPLDQRFLDFVGLDAELLKTQLAQDKSDAEMLDWIKANAKFKRTPEEIAAWSKEQEQRGPDADSQKYFDDYHSKMAPHRKDVATWYELLDIDDFVSYGGKA